MALPAQPLHVVVDVLAAKRERLDVVDFDSGPDVAARLKLRAELMLGAPPLERRLTGSAA